MIRYSGKLDKAAMGRVDHAIIVSFGIKIYGRVVVSMDINNSAFVYSVNMLRLLLKMQFITAEEYERILQISAAHYDAEKIYV